MWYIFLKGFDYILRNIGNKINTFVYTNSFKKVGKNVKVFKGFYCSNPKSIVIGNNVLIDSNCSFSSEFSDSKFIIGNNVKINSNCKIDFSGDIIIDDNTTISANTVIFSHSHGYDPSSKPIKKSLHIKENVWIGSNAIVTENIDYIGENSLIAAGSVVTKNVIENTIVGGNPAKFIKTKI